MPDTVDQYLTAALRRIVDENTILNLMARFDDAILRNDHSLMRRLWVPQGSIWEIGQFNPAGSKNISPLRAEGLDEIVKAQQGFVDGNEFFFRTTLRAVITLNGDRATATAPTTEYARRKDGHGYNNVALYQDTLEQHGDEWLFVARKYYYLWVDSITPIPGGDAIPLPPPLRG